MKNPEDFPYPLNVDIEEQVPVKQVGVDVNEKGEASVSVRTVMQKQTVRYLNVPKVKVRCKDGEHVFRIFDKRKYLFACVKCPFVRKVYPTTYRFDVATGQLIHRYTGRVV